MNNPIIRPTTNLGPVEDGSGFFVPRLNRDISHLFLTQGMCSLENNGIVVISLGKYIPTHQQLIQASYHSPFIHPPSNTRTTDDGFPHSEHDHQVRRRAGLFRPHHQTQHVRIVGRTTSRLLPSSQDQTKPLRNVGSPITTYPQLLQHHLLRRHRLRPVPHFLSHRPGIPQTRGFHSQ